MFAKQFYWYKLRGLLFKLKAILLVQTRGPLFKLRRPRAFQLSLGLFTGCILIGWLQVTRWGRGILPFHGKPKPKSRLPASPSHGSPTVGSIPGSGRFPWGQHGNPLQYSEEDTIFRVYNIQRSIQRSIQCMEGAWKATWGRKESDTTKVTWFLLIRERGWNSWPPEERNSIQGQWRGLIAQRFCVIKFY